MKFSKRSIVEPFRAMEVVALAAEMQAKGDDIVMMCVGQPSAPAPRTARDAAKAAIDKGRIGYTPAKGIEPLRQRVAKHYQERYGIELSPERVIITTGSSAGFMLAFMALFDEENRVAIPSPGYPAYRNILKALSLVPAEIETNSASRWVITPEMLEKEHASNPLRGLLVANPNNPNGTMLKPKAFENIISTSEELGLHFISDEIYHGLTYGAQEESALEYSDNAVIINSFSKYFCMTGWRVGWMIVPEEMIPTINRLQQNAFICAPEISQIAALNAFDGIDELEDTKQGYVKNRQFLLDALPKLGLTEMQPVDGAFYVYANASQLTNDTEQFCREVLTHAKTAITPGTDFDSSRGHAWVRLSFAGSFNEMEKGIERLGNYLSSRL